MCDTEEQKGQTSDEYRNTKWVGQTIWIARTGSGGAYTKSVDYADEKANRPEPNVWHPIETVPKHGEEIDLIVQKWDQNRQKFNRYRVIGIAWLRGTFSSKYKWRFVGTRDPALHSWEIPTHWMRAKHPDGKPWNL